MIKKYPYLKDISFLNKIYGLHNKTVHVLITSLDWQERKLQEIQGRVISSSISVNGDSAVRRTANLSIKILNNTELYNNIDSLFSINKKIYLETGLQNSYAHLGEYSDYPIIWFPFGVYIIQNYSINHDPSGITINLSLGDKMCLLNGDAGGTIPASVNFESIDVLGPDGDLHTEWQRINSIIPEMVHHFGGENIEKIIVNDIDDKIKQPLKWRGSNPLYLWDNNNIANRNIFYTTIDTTSIPNYTKKKIIYNYDAGYTYTDFVYPGELVAGAGDTVCTVLDKIKNTLGNYEYYYDVFGNFIFQEIKNYINVSEWRTAWQDFTEDPLSYLPYVYNTRLNTAVYRFDNSDFIISYSNAPQFNMIKNDFVVWGKRKNDTGLELPCRYHLVIDKRPQLDEDLLLHQLCFDISVDDYIKRANFISNKFTELAQLIEYKPQGEVGKYYYISSENAIYTWINDIDNYYMLLNNYLATNENIESSGTNYQRNPDEPNNGYIKMPLATYYEDFTVSKNTDWRNILYYRGLQDWLRGLTDNNRTNAEAGYYWAEMCNEWPKLYDVENNHWIEGVLEAPSSFDWWIDFIDNEPELNKFSVDAIGRRSYSTTDETCNCVFEPDIPDVIIVNVGDEEGVVDSRSGLTQARFKELGLYPTQVSEPIYDSLSAGGTFNSCYQHVRQLLTNYTNYNENINVTCLPIYHLEPNTRVFFNDPESGIYGDYIINSISFNLGNTGTMSISARKVIEKI